MVGEKPAYISGLIAGTDDNVLVPARLLSKAITIIHDDKLRPFGVSAAQFTLLGTVGQIQPGTRAEIARQQHLDKSTLTRNLKVLLSEGWVEEVSDNADGRSRPIALTAVGKELLVAAHPAWLAAQAEAKALLGKDGIIAVLSVAERILSSSSNSVPVATIKHEDTDATV